MGNTASVTSWSRTFQIIKEKHDAAYLAIEEAIRLEEEEKPHEAIEKYKSGILLIDTALDTSVTCPDNPDFTWEQACVMIQKMKKTRAEALMRINTITSSSTFIPNEPPPTYDEATSGSDIPRTYTDLANALNNLNVQSSNEAAELIYSHEDVRLYFISPDGDVAQTSEPETLYIAAVPGHGDVPKTVFLKIGDFVYPLIPGVSPCYRTSFGAFILPDLQSSVPGSSIGIILPSDADASVYDILESILLGILGQTPTKPPEVIRARRTISIPAPVATQPDAGMSGTISRGLVTGAIYISQGLVSGAQKLGLFLNYGTPKLINTITPATQETIFSPRVTKAFEIVSDTSGAAANFTGYVATQVSSATQALGRYLAPHIQKQGTRLLTTGFNLSEHEASSTVNSVLTVAAGAVEGFSTIYEGLGQSAAILGNNLSNNTVKVISHKYGSAAGHIAGDTFNTVGNVINISHNSKFFTPKGLAKTTAKQAGKAVLEDVTHSVQSTSAASGTSLYPNLHGVGPSSNNSIDLNSSGKKDKV